MSRRMIVGGSKVPMLGVSIATRPVCVEATRPVCTEAMADSLEMSRVMKVEVFDHAVGHRHGGTTHLETEVS